MSLAGVLMRSRARSDRFDDAHEFVAIEALRQIELELAFVGLAVAGEAVGPKRESERRKPRVGRLVGEPVDAVRQDLRQAAGKKRVVARFIGVTEPEQDSAKAASRRQQQVASGLGFETCRIGEGARPLIEPLAQLSIGLSSDEPDRHRICAAAGRED